MNRRELIKAIVPAALVPTLVVNGVAKAAAVTIPPGNYMLFVDPNAVDIEALCESPCPEGVDMTVHAVHVRSGQNIHDTIALYKLNEPKEAV